MQITWRETGGPPVRPPARKGFGTTLIERSLPHDLGGSVSLQYLPEGVRAEFAIPLAQSAAGTDPIDPKSPPAARSPAA